VSAIQAVEEERGANDALRELLDDALNKVDELQKSAPAVPRDARPDINNNIPLVEDFGSPLPIPEDSGFPKQPEFSINDVLHNNILNKSWTFKEISKQKIREWAPPIECFSLKIYLICAIILLLNFNLILSTMEMGYERYVPRVPVQCLAVSIVLTLVWIINKTILVVYAIKYKAHVWTTMRIVQYVPSTTSDVRPDLTAMSDLKHKNQLTYRVEFYREFYRPAADVVHAARFKKKKRNTLWDRGGGVLFANDWLTACIITALQWKMDKGVRKESKHKRTQMIVSAELLMQVLSQPVCKLNALEETTWLRINQTLTSLHTVNEDKRLVLTEQMMQKQETAVAANFIFKCEVQRLRNVPFPRPH
jgi:hypothetical protein